MRELRIPSARGSLRVWQRNATIFRKYWKTILLPNFVEPLLYLAALGLGLGAFIQQGGINGQTYYQYVAPGLLASNAMFAASFESTFNTFVKLKIQRVYDAIVATPVNAVRFFDVCSHSPCTALPPAVRGVAVKVM